MKTILAIGAHFDDIELGCGGTLYKHIQMGHKVILAIMDSNEYRTGSIVIRHIEQEKSMKMLGIPVNSNFLFTGFIEDELENSIHILDTFKPDIIFVPFEKDTHQAHVRASTIGKAVGRKRHITTFYYDSGSTYNFQPNIFSEIDFDFKYKLLQCFKSQIDCNAINLDIVKKKNSYLASLVTEDNKYAEGFMVRKMIYKIEGY